LAINSTPRRRFGVALGVVLTGVTAGLIGFAGIASAHTKDVSAACKGETTTLNVDLKSYATSNNKSNHVKITDGSEVLVDKPFQAGFKQSFSTSGAVEHTFTVSVTAFDDDKYSFDKTLHVKACVTPPPSSSTTTTSKTSQSTTTTTTTVAPPSSTTSTEVQPVVETTPVTTTTTPAVQGEALAETGASIAVPLIIGAVLLVGGVVLMVIVRRRSKA
jgi:cobalamin biosynthesis Mg chelatase CobN